MSATLFGTKDADGIDYKYLWNVEGIISTDFENTQTIDYTDVELMQTYSGGRVPDSYISYYAASHTSTAPDGQPAISADGNTITSTEGSVWTTDFALEEDDQEDYLFEITFVKYKEKDEEGKNLY